MFRAKRFMRFLATRAGALLAVSLLLISGGAVALANTASTPNAATRQAAQRRALIARKRREGHHRKQSHRRTTGHAAAVGPGTTFPDQGVTLGSPSPQASQYAAASSLSTASAAVAAFQQLPAAQSVFGPALTSGNPSASLVSVTEQDPVVSNVTAGSSYAAWVVSLVGPEIGIGVGGPPVPSRGSSTPPAAQPPATTTMQCQDVGIYDLQLGQWTEMLQHC